MYEDAVPLAFWGVIEMDDGQGSLAKDARDTSLDQWVFARARL